ncbi:hypothetical protein BS47DRAFT_1361743 [Hydnum rufescens UP504]|uniref:Uncharacterized protein n=1 Tax=Hydnum rufescens UP504 TaxID=1448309 RepID=A0A9P6AYS8_9AGAM|nr:hypothetical protein BS47DRAFT_1361743 [Hydnum rufescens UP504]
MPVSTFVDWAMKKKLLMGKIQHMATFDAHVVAFIVCSQPDAYAAHAQNAILFGSSEIQQLAEKQFNLKKSLELFIKLMNEQLDATGILKWHEEAEKVQQEHELKTRDSAYSVTSKYLRNLFISNGHAWFLVSIPWVQLLALLCWHHICFIGWPLEEECPAPHPSHTNKSWEGGQWRFLVSKFQKGNSCPIKLERWGEDDADDDTAVPLVIYRDAQTDLAEISESPASAAKSKAFDIEIGSSSRFEIGSSSKFKIRSSSRSKIGSSSKFKIGSSSRFEIGSSSKFKIGASMTSNLDRLVTLSSNPVATMHPGVGPGGVWNSDGSGSGLGVNLGLSTMGLGSNPNLYGPSTSTFSNTVPTVTHSGAPGGPCLNHGNQSQTKGAQAVEWIISLTATLEAQQGNLKDLIAEGNYLVQYDTTASNEVQAEWQEKVRLLKEAIWLKKDKWVNIQLNLCALHEQLLKKLRARKFELATLDHTNSSHILDQKTKAHVEKAKYNARLKELVALRGRGDGVVPPWLADPSVKEGTQISQEVASCQQELERCKGEHANLRMWFHEEYSAAMDLFMGSKDEDVLYFGLLQAHQLYDWMTAWKKDIVQVPIAPGAPSWDLVRMPLALHQHYDHNSQSRRNLDDFDASSDDNLEGGELEEFFELEEAGLIAAVDQAIVELDLDSE